MARKKEYHKDDVLCEKTGVKFLRELSPRVKYYNGYKCAYRRVEAKCSCGRTFQKELSDIKRGALCQHCGKEKHRDAMTQYVDGYAFGDYGTALLRRIAVNGHSWDCEFQCGRCGKTFTMSLNELQKSKYKICHECVIEITKEQRCKYNVGDIIENPDGVRFLFEEELPVEEGQMRRGVFYEINQDNEQIGKRFSAIVYNVALGSADGSNSRANKRFLECLVGLPYIYKTEVSFNDLLSDKGFPLRYDFCIYYKNQTILVELDGEQHFSAINHFGGEEGYKTRLRNDELKNNYAQEHEYSLIRIPYTEFSSISPELIKKLVEGGE